MVFISGNKSFVIYFESSVFKVWVFFFTWNLSQKLIHQIIYTVINFVVDLFHKTNTFVFHFWSVVFFFAVFVCFPVMQPVLWDGGQTSCGRLGPWVWAARLHFALCPSQHRHWDHVGTFPPALLSHRYGLIWLTSQPNALSDLINRSFHYPI